MALPQISAARPTDTSTGDTSACGPGPVEPLPVEEKAERAVHRQKPQERPQHRGTLGRGGTHARMSASRRWTVSRQKRRAEPLPAGADRAQGPATRSSACWKQNCPRDCRCCAPLRHNLGEDFGKIFPRHNLRQRLRVLRRQGDGAADPIYTAIHCSCWETWHATGTRTMIRQFCKKEKAWPESLPTMPNI